MPCEFYLDRQKFHFPDGSLGFLFCPSKAKTKTTNILKLNRLSSNTTWLWFIFVLLQSSFLLFYFFFLLLLDFCLPICKRRDRKEQNKGRPRGMVQGGRREEGSGWGTRGYLGRIHVDIWQNQYNIVKLKNKIKLKKNVGT